MFSRHPDPVRSRLRRPTWALASLLAVGCTGSVGDGGATPGPNQPAKPNQPGDPNQPGMSEVPPPTAPTSPTGSGRTGVCKDTFDPGLSPLRLLTRREYENTVRDLLDLRDLKDLEMPVDTRPERGFENDTHTRSASDKHVVSYLKGAEKLAAATVAQLSQLTGGCDPAKDGDSTCLDRFFDRFGKRVFRRPLTPAERQDFTAAFNDFKGKGFAAGIEGVATVMFMSPQFLYRYEQGVPVTGTNHAKLTSWEVASRLSYLLWGTMPDADLMAAAEADRLSRPEDVAAQARKMTADPRYLATVTSFAEQLFGVDHIEELDKDANLLPAWKADLRPAMHSESRRFFESVLGKDGDGKVSTLLTARHSFMNKALADYAGVSGPTGDAFVKVELDPAKASGLLTQVAWLAVHGNADDGLTSLVFRGKFVREQLLCTPIQDPPPNAEDENPPFDENTTSREWADARMAKPVCGACHRVMDPIGFLFENFDATGRYRTTDRGKPVNAAGELTGADVTGTFTGVPELGGKLAGSKQVRDCMATQWFRFGVGRMDDPRRDACSLETLQNKLAAANGDLRELFVAIAETDAFLFRSKGDDK